MELNSRKNEDKIIEDVIGLIDSIEPGLNIQVLENKNKLYIKKDIILGGLNCAHCAEVIGNKVSSLDGVKTSNINFVNKKLTLELNSRKNEDKIIEDVIGLIL